MQFRTFGRTGWQLSEITFGAWQLGGNWGAVDEKELIDTLLYDPLNDPSEAHNIAASHTERVEGMKVQL